MGITAGFVNAAGFLAFSVLTTNVTGHAALFAERLAVSAWSDASLVALWMALFFLGAVVSSFLLSLFNDRGNRAYIIAIVVEIGLILTVALINFWSKDRSGIVAFSAGSLLFTMGMQNALVSVVSGAVVRTTHLTGTFTDMGIEVGQLFKSSSNQRKVLKIRIRLKLVIILCFIGGALAGGYLFRFYRFLAFLVPIGILVYILIQDTLHKVSSAAHEEGKNL